MAYLFAAVPEVGPRLRSVGMLDETVHERVRRLRERAKLSQADVETATEGLVSESWLQKFENKQLPKYPTRDQLEPLAKPLGVPLSYLMAPMRLVPIEEVQQPSVEGAIYAQRKWPAATREALIEIIRLADAAIPADGDDDAPEVGGEAS